LLFVQIKKLTCIQPDFVPKEFIFERFRFTVLFLL